MQAIPVWLEPLVWVDYQTAVGLTVILPLLLLGWAFARGLMPLIQMLIIYWRVSSLLAITVYLMIGAFPISFLTGLAARVLIVFSLWFWADLSREILQTKGLLSLCFRVWRLWVTAYLGVGSLFSAWFIPCAFQQPLSETCQVWFEPPLAFREIIHPNIARETLGLVGLIGLTAYGLYSMVFLWRLNRQSVTPTL
ncbi:MAG: DUF3177 family protein [Cyanobacteriota bacterium]|nr:DUF3177 family protein [Cyanobacteriota bacterium]